MESGNPVFASQTLRWSPALIRQRTASGESCPKCQFCLSRGDFIGLIDVDCSPVEVMFLVLQDSDPVSMVRFGMVCFGAHEIVVDFMRRSYTVRKQFADFMPSDLISEFRSVQRETGAIVSGSTSLGFFLRKRFPNSDFDVFVNYGHFNPVQRFLRKAGYGKPVLLGVDKSITAVHPLYANIHIRSTSYTNNGIVGVYEFVHESSGEKAQVVLAFHSPVDIVLEFHSTAPMTFMTHSTAVSLYPLATFGLELNFAKYDERPPARQGRAKYQDRGWITAGPECVYPDAVMRSVERHVGDRFCWTIPLTDNDASGVVPAVYVHSWTLVYPSPEAGWINQYAILSLPAPKEGICVSRSVIIHFKPNMAKWTQGYFAKFIHNLLTQSYAKRYIETQPS